MPWGAQLSFSKPESLAERVAAGMSEQIINGVLIEGERIQELRFAKQLAVSRGSIREAILILKRTGLVQVYPCRGAVVSELSVAHVSSAFRVLKMLCDEIIDYVCANPQHGFNHQLGTLQARLKILQSQAAIPQKFLDEIFVYPCQLLENSQHPYLHSLYLDILPAIRRSYYYSLSRTNYKLNDAFSMICAVIDGLNSKNSHQAALFMQEFCRHLQHVVQQSLIQIKQVELDWACRQAY